MVFEMLFEDRVISFALPMSRLRIGALLFLNDDFPLRAFSRSDSTVIL